MVYYIVFFLWVIIANSTGFNLMYWDKVSAEEGGKRVKERDLFLIAALFGAISIYLSMHVLKHKRRKYYFKYGLFALVIENLVLGMGVLLLIYSLL